MYGVNDNPKEKKIFGRELSEFGIGSDLWIAKIYPICETVEEAVKQTLEAIESLIKNKKIAKEKNIAEDKKIAKDDDKIANKFELTSLKDSFNNADVTAILPWQENLYEQVVAEAILDKINHGICANEVKKSYPIVNKHTVDYLLKKAEKLNIEKLDEFKQKIRIYAYLSKIMDSSSEKEMSKNTDNNNNTKKSDYK